MQNFFLEPEDGVQSELSPEQDFIINEVEAETAPVAVANDGFVKISAAKLELVYKNIERLEEGVKQLKNLLGAMGAAEPTGLIVEAPSHPRHDEEQGRVIEGVFDGEKMIGSDGEVYSVPVNYASKSKLVEGDILKLTVTNRGAFVFKQIGPIDRSRLVGQLAEDELGNFWVLCDGRKWRILSASVTYFKGDPGDEATILVPKEGTSRWAAVENIVKKW